MTPLVRNNVKVSGGSGSPIIFAHGYGCDQNMWRLVAPAFADDHKIILFDHVGAGNSDHGSWSTERYADLTGYARDLAEIAEALDLRDATFIGHSVSAMIGILASKMVPGRFSRLVLVGPSPCYVNDPPYVGGFERADIEELLSFMDSNFLGWSSTLTPQIMGNPDRPELANELNNSFCRTDPEIAKHFARVTFLSDNRSDLNGVDTPTLILQCSEDVIAPEAVSEYMKKRLPQATLVKLKATGHCPHLSAPEETIAAIRKWL